ncbi:glycosyltransferase [Mucilaginibacter sp. UYCu711]|uniref:glycosyltransferase n=1 Tax=Mucilaginibacter sp. UYCu711 TaxID=3156339 RepID=UPI003D22B5BF
MGVKNIVFITSGQPSLNPRLVKEADTLANAGYTVTVLYMYWNAWGANFDQELLASKKWRAVCVGGDPQYKRALYFLSRLIHKLAQTVNRKTKGRFMADIAIARASYFLIREAKKYVADLYIGHNLGALPAVVGAAKINNKPSGFDAEDFHRYEMSDDDDNHDVILKMQIENKHIPQLNYFTTSSPQIAEAYSKIFTSLKPAVLLNVFHKSDIVNAIPNSHQPLKLLWFSQTIGANRGLQDIIGALQLLDNKHFELHLLGSKLHTNATFINYLTGSKVNIRFHDPIPPDKLPEFAGQFDIGLALEPGFSTNNNLALSNKLFTYMQAGLAIIASDTIAQKDFITKNPTIGHTYPARDTKAMAAILSSYYKNGALLTLAKNESLRLAHELYNWEVESKKFLKIVEHTL